MAQLPEDMVIEILVRLPVKSVVFSKLVCKTWYHLLNNPTFISMHHKFNLGTVSQLLMCSSPENKDINNHVFSFHSNHKSATVLSPDLRILANPDTHVYLAGSCNGIVCYHDGLSVFLSNPATREFIQLPPSSFHQEGIHQFYVTGFAFGFESTNIYDFKVLRLFTAPNKKGFPKPTHKSFMAEMFTLSSNTWNQLHWGLDNNVVFTNYHGLFFANSFHFIVSHHKGRRKAIASCDIHTERFRTMDLPSSTGKGFFQYLMVLKEFVSAVCAFPGLDSERISTDIWIMKDYGVEESWTKLYCIRPPYGIGRPLCFWTVKDALLLGLDENKLVSYHLDTQSVESIQIHGYGIYSQLFVHQETLVSIMCNILLASNSIKNQL